MCSGGYARRAPAEFHCIHQSLNIDAQELVEAMVITHA